MHKTKLFVALGALAVNGWAQPSTAVSGPVTGFVFSPSGWIRPMLGVPGAAYLGPAVATGLEAAAIAPDGSAALAVQQAGKLMLYGSLRSNPVALAVSGGIPAVSQFAWAPDAASAAVYAPLSRQGQIISNLAATPSAGAPIDLSQLPGPVMAMAFDGQHLILGVSSAEAGGIYLAGAQGGVERMAAAASPVAIVLAGSSLYFADNQANQIFQVQNYAGSAAPVVFAGDSSIDNPIGLQPSPDGQRLYAADGGSRKLVVYDVASRSVIQTIGLSFAPTRLDLFGDPSVFLMNDGSQGPFYVVRDGAAGKAAVYFVPLPRMTHPVKPPIRPA